MDTYTYNKFKRGFKLYSYALRVTIATNDLLL
jgi:hypothetical protein